MARPDAEDRRGVTGPALRLAALPDIRQDEVDPEPVGPVVKKEDISGLAAAELRPVAARPWAALLELLTGVERPARPSGKRAMPLPDVAR